MTSPQRLTVTIRSDWYEHVVSMSLVPWAVGDLASQCGMMFSEFTALNPAYTDPTTPVNLGETYQVNVYLPAPFSDAPYRFAFVRGVQVNNGTDWEVATFSELYGVFGQMFALVALNPTFLDDSSTGPFMVIEWSGSPAGTPNPSYYVLAKEPYLRMRQRNDGDGIAQSARLSVGQGTGDSTSVQTSQAPRVGTSSNRYR